MHSKLEARKADIVALGAETDEMREKMRMHEKKEKTERGHTAMTEELRRMEEEIGLKVTTRSQRLEVESIISCLPCDPFGTVQHLELKRDRTS